MNGDSQWKIFGLGLAVLVHFAVVVRMYTKLEANVESNRDKWAHFENRNFSDRLLTAEQAIKYCCRVKFDKYQQNPRIGLRREEEN